jgi:hypothetical protein
MFDGFWECVYGSHHHHDQPSLPRGLVLCVTGWVEDFEEFRVQVVGVGYPGVQ